MLRAARRLAGLNWVYLGQKALGRPTCVREKSSQITSSARIINILGDSSKISVGAHSVIAGDLVLFGHGGRISIGDWSFVGPGTRIWSGSSIIIGDRVMIAHNVSIFDNLTHPLESKARHEHFRRMMTEGHPRDIELGEKPVAIGDDAWIGAGSIVLRGVNIGKRAVVGAGSVVTRDVPEGALVVGNPARVARNNEADDIEQARSKCGKF